MGCFACSVASNPTVVTGGTVVARDGWTLNHYHGDDRFLGRLVLQPSRHVSGMSDLEKREAEAMGEAIQAAQDRLRKAWSSVFPGDPLGAVYVVRFGEAHLNDDPVDCHLHFHLIPRPRSFLEVLRKDGIIDAWRVSRVALDGQLPIRYKATPDSMGRFMAVLSEV